MGKSIFREKSLQSISSPEQLNESIKVATPSSWLTLLFILVLLTAVIIWSFLGKLPTSITLTGYAENGEIVCYLSPKQAEELTENVSVMIDGTEGKLTAVSEMPLSKKEIAQKYTGDYLIDKLAVHEWSREVKASSAGVSDGLHEIVLITETVRPISFLLN